MKTLNYFFDFLSPYSYFSWFGVQALDQEMGGELQVKYVPVVLGKLLSHWGIKGPAEVVPKRDYLLRHCLRYAGAKGLPFRLPQNLPFNSLYALRMALHSTGLERQKEVIECLWKFGWQEGKDLEDPEALVMALNRADLPGALLMERSFDSSSRKELKDNVEMALSMGVFGVPSFVLDGELFWGNEALKHVKEVLTGNDHLTREPAQSEYLRYQGHYFQLP